MPSAILPDKEVFVMVGCTERRLRQHAEDLEYEVQLLSSREYRKYEVEDDHLFLPFRSQERMEIIMKKMQDDVFDLDAYLECGVVLRTFPLHDPNERDLVSKLWLPKVYYWPFSCCCTKTAIPPFSFCKDLRKEGSDLSFAHLTALKMYFGEKVAFYYAWYSHYTAYLAVAAVPGLIVLLVQVLQVLEMGAEGKSFLVLCWCVFSGYFLVCVALWLLYVFLVAPLMFLCLSFVFFLLSSFFFLVCLDRIANTLDSFFFSLFHIPKWGGMIRKFGKEKYISIFFVHIKFMF